ncbi:MAG TPA: acetate/propionate family kinase [Steroidobacteraceae bacterium]|nr:acetate/propionate family kinase [Steroidobacteraceae bacterium]
MEQAQGSILAINGGSSSIRFALFAAGNITERTLSGKIDRIGLPGTTLTATTAAAPVTALPAGDFPSSIRFLLDWLDERQALDGVVAVGHRVVHGMRHAAPERVTPQLLAQLRGLIAYDPEHLPAEIRLMEALLQRLPQRPQLACFDTAFHRTLPRVASVLPIPRRYEALGVRRYGFHGLSYACLMEQLAALGDPAARAGRVILAHLGNGASLAAVRDGACVDTTMGFTPAAGVPMSTRSGDLDPGLVSFLAATEQMTAAAFQRMVTRESGLLGVSGTSSDVRDLLGMETTDIRAAEALALFCQEIRKRIGAFAAVLGGLDTLVFSAGIGENSAVIRGRICAGLEFLGLRLDERRNAAHAGVISTSGSNVTVRVLRTDEERMIAQLVRDYVRQCAGEQSLE